jgi:O-antigen ligase
MVSSLLSSFSASSAANSVITIVKETYLFIWFITTTILLSKFREKDFRFVLRAWSIVVAIHGLLMIAQFISPDVWRISNSLGGNTARVEGYRAAGLFICDKAGCANKAAFYQIIGFVPILLAGYSKRTTVLLGITALMGMLAAGSMGAVLAFSSGLIVAGLTIAFFTKKLLLVIKYMIQFALTIMLLGGIFYIIGSNNPNIRDHFERIIVGRYERSSGGRLNLWQRGIDVLLENKAFFWGVGPENFRVVDAAETDNQLHNDTLAFLVERGFIGVSGLALFAGIAIKRAISILQITAKSPTGLRMGLIVFLAFIAATVVESITHQVFRTRELWLVLAVQETVYFNLKTSPMEIELTPGTIKVQEVQYEA